MPVMDGMETARAIRKLERSRRQNPAMIIALTGLGSATTQQEAFASGMNIFLPKPVRFNELRKILKDWNPDMELGHGVRLRAAGSLLRQCSGTVDNKPPS